MQLKVNDLNKKFGRDEILHNLSLTVDSGTLFGLVGPNGAGKSTLMHCICGIERLHGGTIQLGQLSSGSKEFKRRVGFMPDTLPIPDYLSGIEYINLTASLRQPLDSQLAVDLCRGLGLPDSKLRQLVGTYSHGTRKKLQLSVELARSPQLLILDEPFSGLDPTSHAIVERLLTALKADNRTVVISTHDMRLAQELFDQVALLKDGEIIASGQPCSLIAGAGAASLRDVFISHSTGQSRIEELTRDLSERILS